MTQLFLIQNYFILIRADGITGESAAEDIHIDSIYNGLSLINIGTCSDPVPKEKVNFVDALDLRSIMNSTKCVNDANECRKEIRTAMTSKRGGWGANSK